MEETRTKKSIKNALFMVFFQVFGILISFIARAFFLKYLGEVYLGLNGLFTNILSVLSLVELGVGAAISFSLYKPLAEKDTEKIKSIMALYKKIYIIVGLVIFVAGLCLLPLLGYIVGSEYAMLENLHFIFILYVLNTSVTYFYSYKRSLICADQNKYIDTVNRYVFLFILNAVQILVLYFTKNFIIFLFCQTISNLLENISITLIINKKYPYINGKSEKLDKETKKSIYSNSGALLCHKIGGIFVGSIDSILITIFVGLAIVGRYSNYVLIVAGLDSIIKQFFIAFTASIGNLGVTETKEKKLEIFYKIVFLNFAITNFSFISLNFLLNNFINIWLGNYVLTNIEVLFIALNFLFSCIRRPVLTFKDALGIYKQDLWKPFVEVVFNLISSIILGYYFGLVGILLGTIMTYTFVSCWIEVKVLFKYGLQASTKLYMLKMLKFVIVLLISFVVSALIFRFIGNNSFLTFFIRLIVCIIVPNLIFIIAYFRDKEMKYYVEFVKNIVFRKKKRIDKEKKV